MGCGVSASKGPRVYEIDSFEAVEQRTPPARAELQSMRLSELQQRARELCVSPSKLERAENSEQPKLDIIEVIMASAPPPRAARPRGKSGAMFRNAVRATTATLRMELAGLKLAALQARAAEIGVNAAQLEEAEDGDTPRQSIIELIIAATPMSDVAKAEAAAELLRAELKGLKLAALQQRAKEAAVDAAELEEAEDSDTPKQSIIELIVSASAVAPSSNAAVVAKLTAELSCLKLSQLRQRARAAGVDQEQLLDVLDSDDPKDALVSLLAAATSDTTVAATAAAAHAQKMKALEEELGQLRLGQLEKRAVQEGIPVVELDDAMDGEKPKVAIIQLILARQPGGQNEGITAALLAFRQTLEAELRGLRLGGANGLHSRAVAAGVDADTIEDVLDADEPKKHLIELILSASQPADVPVPAALQMDPNTQAIFDALSSAAAGAARDVLSRILLHSAELLDEVYSACPRSVRTVVQPIIASIDELLESDSGDVSKELCNAVAKSRPDQRQLLASHLSTVEGMLCAVAAAEQDSTIEAIGAMLRSLQSCQSEGAFEGKVGELSRELGERGKDRSLSSTNASSSSATAARFTCLHDTAGGEAAVAALTAAFETALEVLEHLIPTIPRPDRKTARVLCERVESIVESIDIELTDQMLAPLTAGDSTELTALTQALTGMADLKLGAGGVDCIPVIESACAALAQATDPAVASSKLVQAVSSADRLRGFSMMSALPMKPLPTLAQGEAELVDVLLETVVADGSTMTESVAAWLAVFTLCFRNHNNKQLAAAQAPSRAAVAEVITAASTSTSGGATLIAAASTVFVLGCCSVSVEPGPDNDALDKAVAMNFGLGMKTQVAEPLARELTSMLAEMVRGGNLLMGCGASIGLFYAFNQTPESALQLDAALASSSVEQLERIKSAGFSHSVEWWQKQQNFKTRDIVSIWFGGYIMPFAGFGPVLAAVSKIPDSPSWRAIVEQLATLAIINQKAQLSPESPLLQFQTLNAAATNSHHCATLLQMPGLVDAMLYGAESKLVMFNMIGKAFAASTCVSLIGKNEGGVTLTRSAVDAVVADLYTCFDPSSWRFSFSATRLVSKAKAVLNTAISDANKRIVVENNDSIDALVKGLLLDKDDPRRTQDHAGDLQEVCALALQNLALSADIGREPLQGHTGAMAGLRTVAAEGMTEAARRAAAGALFELDEEARQKAKEAAAAKAAVVEASGSVAEDNVEHVMLSYNWSHQDVVKRINQALKARSYNVWIDVEKMQGSTVEAMADAVEEAAVMVYGISRAYKESANCRLEAQYGYQQKKDMVPLMLEEGYQANGWLGMLLGVRLWYGFFGPVLESEGAFERKVDELSRELGERGKQQL